MLMVVYDMMNQQSFKNCAKWIDEVNSVVNKAPGRKLPGILVGAKCDMKDHSPVKYEDAVELAHKYG